MYIYDNTNLLAKRRRKTRARVLDQIKILSLLERDEKTENLNEITESQNKEIKRQNSTLENLKKINDERIKKLEKEESERRENEIVNKKIIF